MAGIHAAVSEKAELTDGRLRHDSSSVDTGVTMERYGQTFGIQMGAKSKQEVLLTSYVEQAKINLQIEIICALTDFLKMVFSKC